CGVRIPYSKRLSGHSDADAGLHALTDALLATCGAGDIGDHFPPTDPKWKGAESHIFLSEACRVVAAHGGTIINVDVTLICEAPKIGPHRQDMRERLASLTDIDIARCSVKATTNEKMGFIGRQEGMCAMATASVRFA
ncbi:MAG: 2-C-methyl-D-erythritol 2,4-cyclodiphosphate synthase, partial [Pseudomonadota bacterium]